MVMNRRSSALGARAPTGLWRRLARFLSLPRREHLPLEHAVYRPRLIVVLTTRRVRALARIAAEAEFNRKSLESIPPSEE